MNRPTVTGRDPSTGQPLTISVEDGRISSVTQGGMVDDLWLAPGLIDLQVNGYGGCDLNGDTIDPDVVITLTERLAATGVTTYLPTIITAPEEKIVRALRAIAGARAISPAAAHAIPFVHVEGPSLSLDDGPRGAHAREHVRPPDLAEFARWQAASDNLVGMVTLSPHWEGALEYIAALSRQGVAVAIGHTNADPDRIHAAAAAGATLSTHLGNGTAERLLRHPNLIWAQLADDRLSATFIADGHHLPADTLRAMLRAKGPERSILISDAVALAGMPAGTCDSPVGGRVELSADGRLSLAGTPYLAGAARPLRDGVARVSQLPGFTLADAVRFATRNPGRIIGSRGVLTRGADADLILFRWNATELEIASAWVKGEIRS